MNEWQRGFLKKMESAKKQWLHRFEAFACEFIEPVFLSYEEFAGGCGFQVNHPNSDAGIRIFKFALTENGYMLITFRMKGLEEVEVSSESVVPGMENHSSSSQSAHICDAGQAWVEAQFQSALDFFITQFGDAGGASVESRGRKPALAGAK